MEGILGRKVGMTQVYDQMGNRIPVTVVLAGPCKVMTKRKSKKDAAVTNVQLAFDPCRDKVLNKPRVGYFAAKGMDAHRHLREFFVTDAYAEGLQEGGEVRVEHLFRAGDKVDVSGTSKGRGFTGVIKRHGMKGAKASHGSHEYFRHGGSIGSSADPSHVFKGLRMAGQHGNTRSTVQNLVVVQVFADRNLLLIKGAVPGPPTGLVEIRRAVKSNARPSELL